MRRRRSRRVAALLEGETAAPRAAQAIAAGSATTPRRPPRDRAAGDTLPGVVASRGVAIGTAAFIARAERSVAEMGAGASHETAELARARDAVRERLRVLAAGEQGPRSEIATAHLEFLDDPDLVAAAAESIARGESAGYAWRSAVRASIAALRDLGDTLLAERADDLLDLESQVLAALAGETGSAAVELPERAIVLADELLPSQLIALDAGRIAGIGTARGGATSHVAILAAAMGKPMLVASGRGDSRDRARNAPCARRRAAAACRSTRRARGSPRPSVSSRSVPRAKPPTAHRRGCRR